MTLVWAGYMLINLRLFKL